MEIKRIKREVRDRIKSSLIGLCEKEELEVLFKKVKGFLKGQNQELLRLNEEKIKVYF